MEASEGKKRIEKKEGKFWNKAERVNAGKEGTRLTSCSPSAILEASLCLTLYQRVLEVSREFVTQARSPELCLQNSQSNPGLHFIPWVVRWEAETGGSLALTAWPV